ncbi:MAG: peptidylprolyl isomerase, partial [Planctomycetes bacterium]|nr:peptidylprolyl isomerase [Planctomycetota bacterium]
TDKPASKPANPRVKLSTTMGDIVLELDAEKAPVTVENFLAYVNDGFYDGLIFHRVMPNFMIQAGGFDAEVDRRTKGMRPPIKLESLNGLTNAKGTIAMARSGPNTATSQFFINVVDNARLDGRAAGKDGYAVFGKVVEGMDVVEKIRTTDCFGHPKYNGGRKPVTPKVPVVISKATVLGADGKTAKKPEAKNEPTDKKAKEGEAHKEHGE